MMGVGEWVGEWVGGRWGGENNKGKHSEKAMVRASKRFFMQTLVLTYDLNDMWF